MPQVDELLDKIGQARYITTLDLTRGYWQVPVAEESCSKTAFSKPLGLYQYTVMAVQGSSYVSTPDGLTSLCGGNIRGSVLGQCCNL